MKKSDFQKTVKDLFLEFYPKGGVRSLQEYDPQVPESPENQENPEYYDQPRPEMDQPSANWDRIDWREVHAMLVDNTRISDEVVHMDLADRRKLFQQAHYYNDFAEGLPENIISQLEHSYVIDNWDGILILTQPELKDFSQFMAKVNQAKTSQGVSYEAGNNHSSEVPYLRGTEMDENMYEIYKQFKNIIKENINEVDFATKIRGVFYEYAQGVEQVTPTTTNPTRGAEADPVANPDQTEQTGKDMKELGQAVEDLGKKAKQIKSRPDTVTMKEYVDQEILPAVVEILKQAENPRATKQELLEFFKLKPK